MQTAVQPTILAPSTMSPLGGHIWPEGPAAPALERLPFTVKIAQSPAQLRQAMRIRHAAYLRHVPEFAAKLREPEPADTAPGAVVLLAESKLDGSALGSMRIQTNEHGPLALEASLELPLWLQDHGMAEATRLGVTREGSGRLVKTMLFKAYYRFCVERGLRYMVITARSPVDRMYERLLFQDVYPGMGYIPLAHVFNLPHRVMFLDVARAHELWAEEGHPLLDFMCHTEHPDLHVGLDPTV